MPLLNMIRHKVMFQQAELAYNTQTARTEAGRCLRRDVCTRGNICARTANCPTGAMRVEYRGEKRYLEHAAAQTAEANPKAVQSIDCPTYARTAWSRIAPDRLAFQ